MFFARFVVWMGGMLPKGKLRGRLFQIFDYLGCRQKVVAWHRAELEKLDPLFQLQQDGLRLVVAREKARAEGISSMGPRYLDISNFSEIDWDEEVKVHSRILRGYRGTGKERMQRLDEAVRNYPQERVDAVTQACTDALKPEK